MQTCFSEPEAYELVSGKLDAASTASAHDHLDSCDACQDLVATLVAVMPHPRAIGRYQVCGTLGRGAMGDVFEAADPQLGRQVAVKVLRVGRQHATAKARLLTEARAIAKISHPNVISVYDAGEYDDEVFMVMELIRGGTLRAMLAKPAKAPMPWQARLQICVAAGRGIAAAHAAQLTHRDIKPDNILLSDDGRVLVTDFGLVGGDAQRAAWLSQSVDSFSGARVTATLTETGTILGTPAYMAPELLLPTSAQLVVANDRSDQFSFAVTLYEALNGERPFVGTDLASLQAALARPAPMLKLPDAPAQLATVIDRGLALDPAARWPSMTDMLNAIDQTMSRWRRRRWTMLVGAGVAVAGIVGAVTMYAAQSTKSKVSCHDGAGSLAAIWNDETRSRLGQAFAASGSPLGRGTWTVAEKSLGGYADSLAAVTDQGCRLTKNMPATAVEVVTRCVVARQREFQAMLDAFAKPTDAQVQRFSATVGRLVDPHQCLQLSDLLDELPLPNDPAIAAQVAQLDTELIGISARYAAGGWAEAELELKRIADAATAIGYAPLEARAEKARAKQLLDTRKLDEAIAAMDRAVLAAERSRAHRVRADLLLARAFAASEQRKHGEALEHLKVAEAVIDGLADSATHRAHLASYRATALSALGRGEEAVAQARSAVTLYIQTEGETSTSLSNPYTMLAFAAYRQGDLKTAGELLRKVADIQLQTLGDAHPHTGQALSQVASVELEAGDLDGAQHHSERAREIIGRALGTDAFLYAKVSRPLVAIAAQRGELAKAEKFAREIVGVVEKVHGVDSAPTAPHLADLADVLQRQRALPDALALFERVAHINASADAPPLTQALDAKNVAGVLADMGRCKMALPGYRHATSLLRGDAADPLTLAEVNLGLARCAIATGQARTARVPLAAARKVVAAATTPFEHLLLVQGNWLQVQVDWATGNHQAAIVLAQATVKMISSDALEVEIGRALSTWLKTHVR
ncbi:MAG: protein kinase [Kofleriaceae bacterium]|nr:protein kinase [Kofleriaceae bacterium]